MSTVGSWRERRLNEATGVSGGFGMGVFAGHWSRVSSHETYNGGREMGGGRGWAGWLEVTQWSDGADNALLEQPDRNHWQAY